MERASGGIGKAERKRGKAGRRGEIEAPRIIGCGGRIGSCRRSFPPGGVRALFGAIRADQADVLELRKGAGTRCLKMMRMGKRRSLAAELNHPTIISELLHFGANVNKKCDRKTPLQVAVERTHWDVINVFALHLPS